MREFAILIQSILLRPANADAVPTPAIGLIAPAAHLRDQISFCDTAIWLLQHLPGGLALLLPLMAALMLHALIRKRPLPGARASFRDHVPVLSRPSNRLAPGMGRTTKDDRTASAPVL
jgi:hypothetical protein